MDRGRGDGGVTLLATTVPGIVSQQQDAGGGPPPSSDFVPPLAIHWWDMSNAAQYTVVSGNYTTIVDQVGDKDLAPGGGSVAQTTINSLNAAHDPSVAAARLAMTRGDMAQPFAVMVVYSGFTTGTLFDGRFGAQSAITAAGADLVAAAGSTLTIGPSDAGAHVGWFEFNGVNSKMFIDGELVAQGAAGANSLLGGIKILNNRSNADESNAKVGELMIISGVESAANRSDTITSRLSKWGISGTVDPDPDTPPPSGTALGAAGRIATMGTFFVIGSSQVSNHESIENDVGHPIATVMSSLSVRHTGTNYYGTAKGNASALWVANGGGAWKNRKDVRHDVIIGLKTSPTPGPRYEGVTATTQHLQAILDGDFDADYNHIFNAANDNGYSIDWRLGQENDLIDGSPHSKLGVTPESLWRDAWHYVKDLGRAINNTAQFHFVYLLNGRMWNTLDSLKNLSDDYGHLAGDSRLAWEYAYPDECDGIGMNIYINRGRNLATAVQNIYDLDALCRAEGKTLTISEWGMWNEDGGGNSLEIGNTEARNSLNALLDAFETIEADVRNISYFEGDSGTSIRQNWPQVYNDTYVARHSA